jgi:hypothetical protein
METTTNVLKTETLLSKMWNFSNPIAEKTIGYYTFRICEGFIVEKKKTYLLYKNCGFLGIFDSVQEAKNFIN